MDAMFEVDVEKISLARLLAGAGGFPAIYGGNEEKQAKKEDFGEVCCPLPFLLQDLCLLTIMSHLDAYPAELLGLLPVKLRQRLLSILPILDVCRLERTSVAAGIDIPEIWKSRPAPNQPKYQYSPERGTPCQLNICASYMTQLSRIGLSSEIDSTLVDQSKSCSRGSEAIFSLASDIFASHRAASGTKTELEKAIIKLTTIEGNIVFSNLLTGAMHQPCQTSLCGVRVWKNQATALTIKHTPKLAYYSTEKVDLIPLYRQFKLSVHDDPLEMLSSLASVFGLQPSSAFVHVDFIHSLLLPERLALDSGSSCASSWTTTLNSILSKVNVLKLQCDDYSHFRVFTELIESATGNSCLKYLMCTMPNLYLDVVQPFCTLLSVHSISQLTLEFDKLSPHMLCKLLHAFMTTERSSCVNLKISVKNRLDLPNSLQQAQLASLYKGESFPDCNAEYKILQLLPQREYSRALYLLLQLPTIRLKELTLNYAEFPDYAHLCTLHPDLQITKLKIDVTSIKNFSTVREDLISLLGMPALQKIVVSGCWGNLGEIKLGLVQGFSNRTQSLKKLSLKLSKSDHYKIRDFQMLFEAIFSLPNLESLKMLLGKGFADMICQPRYSEIAHNCWIHKSSGVKLKSICLETRQRELKQLRLIAEEVSFEFKERSHGTIFGDYQYQLDYGDYDDDDDDESWRNYGYGYGVGDFYSSPDDYDYYDDEY